MKKLLGLVLIVGVAILMTQMLPDKKAHKDAMMKAVKEYVDMKAAEKGLGNNVFTNLGKGAVETAAGLAIDMKVKLDNYYLFNTTHVRMKGENKTLSVGVLGMVFTFDKDMLCEALEKGDKTESDDK